MTTKPPTTLAECSRLMNETVDALMASRLTPEQKQHVCTMSNAYLFASKLATTLGAIADEAVSIAKKQ